MERCGVSDRVQFLGYVPDEELLELYANCSAVYYAPFDEDYGYVTVEAFLSGKPVLTCSDAGGVLEFVKHGVTGWVTPPDPAAIAAVLNEIAEQPGRCESLGCAGKERVAAITLRSSQRSVPSRRRRQQHRG